MIGRRVLQPATATVAEASLSILGIRGEVMHVMVLRRWWRVRLVHGTDEEWVIPGALPRMSSPQHAAVSDNDEELEVVA